MSLNPRPLYFDQLRLDQSFDFGNWQLDRNDMVAFAKHWDPQPFHIDDQQAANSPFGGLTASSLYLFAICTKLFSEYRPEFAVLAMLGKDEIRLPAAARPGDELNYLSRCIDLRRSRSKADRGIVTLLDQLKNQHIEIILTQKVTLMLHADPDHEA